MYSANFLVSSSKEELRTLPTTVRRRDVLGDDYPEEQTRKAEPLLTLPLKLRHLPNLTSVIVSVLIKHALNFIWVGRLGQGKLEEDTSLLWV